MTLMRARDISLSNFGKFWATLKDLVRKSTVLVEEEKTLFRSNSKEKSGLPTV